MVSSGARQGTEGASFVITGLDHVVVLVNEIEAAAAAYQTLFARHEGSVAAPTAGLHFSQALIAALQSRGITLHRVTLHVGAGTFLPVKAADTAGHRMHAEHGRVSGKLRWSSRRGGATLGRTNPRQESKSQQHKRDVPVPASETADLIVIQSQIFGIFKILFDMPACANG